MTTSETDGGPNPYYDPWADALDAIADHLQEDDTAYEERKIAEEQAGRIIEAIKMRGLTVHAEPLA